MDSVNIGMYNSMQGPKVKGKNLAYSLHSASSQ